MRNPIDAVVAFFSPGSAVRRAQARRVLSYYEAAKNSTLRKQRRETGSGNAAVDRAGKALREQARHFEQNHDLARGILQTLVQNVVGPTGIGIEPQPRTASGEIHADFAKQILRLFRDWSERPEVTWRRDWAAVQRVSCRSWLRDGDMFAQHLLGSMASLDHGTYVPYSIELLESDMVPLDYHSESPLIISGVEMNAWQRPVAYHLHKTHPGELRRMTVSMDLKRVPADRIAHLAFIDRIGQARGVSVFASVLGRLDDLKDYEESERIAAKVAASMAAFIIKGAPDQYGNSLDEDGEPEPRDLRFRPGMVFDDLEPGEQIGTIDTTRPSTQLEPHRKGQLRAIASGTNTSYSSTAKDYNGTYSSQRQELVEAYGAYGVLSSEFIGQFVRPVYQRFLSAAQMSGELVVPHGIDLQTITNALYIPPQMPWIDPVKEAKAWASLEESVFASGPEIIRRRGQNPNDVLEQEAAWRKQREERGLSPDSTTEKPDNEENEDAEARIRVAG